MLIQIKNCLLAYAIPKDIAFSFLIWNSYLPYIEADVFKKKKKKNKIYSHVIKTAL